MIDKKTAWDQLVKAAQVFLLAAITYYAATKNESPTVNVEVKTPAPAPVVSPKLTPAKPDTIPEVAPEETVLPPKVTTVIVEDQDHNRIRPALANTIANLADFQTGTYYYIGYPEEGTPVRRTITVSDGTDPRPPTTPVDPVKPTTPPVDPTVKATAATYVYEKDQGGVPSAVMSGLNRLNREKKILATVFEEDSTNGKNEVPAQYKTALAEAKKIGMPALIVTAGDAVVGSVKAPTTEQAVFEAVK